MQRRRKLCERRARSAIVINIPLKRSLDRAPILFLSLKACVLLFKSSFVIAVKAIGVITPAAGTVHACYEPCMTQ